MSNFFGKRKRPPRRPPSLTESHRVVLGTHQALETDDSFVLQVLRALDGRPFGKGEIDTLALAGAAPALRDKLAFLVEYLRFHTAESGDWDVLLPEHEKVIAEAESLLGRIQNGDLDVTE